MVSTRTATAVSLPGLKTRLRMFLEVRYRPAKVSKVRKGLRDVGSPMSVHLTWAEMSTPRYHRRSKEHLPNLADASEGRRMRIIWLSAVCAVITVVLLVVGERALPLLGGDRVFAARLYKTVFMVLMSGFLAGLITAASRALARFLRARVEGLTDGEGFFAAWGRFVTRHDIPGLFEAAGPWLATAIGMAGLVMAAVIWASE